jgi:hypothetical protein
MVLIETIRDIGHSLVTALVDVIAHSVTAEATEVFPREIDRHPEAALRHHLCLTSYRAKATKSKLKTHG